MDKADDCNTKCTGKKSRDLSWTSVVWEFLVENKGCKLIGKDGQDLENEDRGGRLIQVSTEV